MKQMRTSIVELLESRRLMSITLSGPVTSPVDYTPPAVAPNIKVVTGPTLNLIAGTPFSGLVGFYATPVLDPPLQYGRPRSMGRRRHFQGHHQLWPKRRTIRNPHRRHAYLRPSRRLQGSGDAVHRAYQPLHALPDDHHRGHRRHGDRFALPAQYIQWRDDCRAGRHVLHCQSGARLSRWRPEQGIR